MFSFTAVLLFLRGALSAIDQTALDNECGPYYTACTGTCATYKNNANSACSGESTNNDYGNCFFNHDATYLANAPFKKLGLCLVENTKNINTFTCFNNDTRVVSCASQIQANMEFKLAPTGTTVIENTRHDTELTVEWADLNIIVKPIDWGNCDIINGSSTCEEAIADLIPHMNLHACKLTDDQKTCSSLFLADTDIDAEVDTTTNALANPGKHYPYILFPSPGTWRLLGHIQIYEDNLSSGHKVKWDVATAVDITVTDKPPTFAPTIPVASEGERKTGGNNVALIICLILVAICAGGCGYCYWFGGFGEDSYDDEDYEIDEEYDGAEDRFVPVGIDDGKDGVELTGKTAAPLEEAPQMDQLATGGLYAKLMANKKAPTPSPGNSPKGAAMPPAPPAPGNVV